MKWFSAFGCGGVRHGRLLRCCAIFIARAKARSCPPSNRLPCRWDPASSISNDADDQLRTIDCDVHPSCLTSAPVGNVDLISQQLKFQFRPLTSSVQVCILVPQPYGFNNFDELRQWPFARLHRSGAGPVDLSNQGRNPAWPNRRLGLSKFNILCIGVCGSLACVTCPNLDSL